mmetsp:Transcript_29823/g.75900  ORF Transcript_29823/g.75900 Transcript_29823/m.75900 type:complete len:260 (+) Transcript_29823:107-886(+)|eukprot:CAMPEP_0195067320 /NCGR_PEP_ID=MMETSP0448-20130528/12416_1 /TAXON_ID=66468 /ORGANISM="Heterocapsa triquestra, Strain CCMP 448" /LENGTH=259 /DNA_ID=CAMNT_0040098719 /DNA_START=21 /DNA_END=800 /DNA_ORIENTATION=-
MASGGFAVCVLLILASGGLRPQLGFSAAPRVAAPRVATPRVAAHRVAAHLVPATLVGYEGLRIARAAAGDFDAAEWPAEPPMRIGHGFDIHRMAAKDDPEVGGPVVVGGVTFDDFDLGIVAHSDGDVIYHSVVDAIFGALTLPDIGQFFPDSDPRWKGAPSDVFMDEAWNQMNARGYRIGNIDVTLIAQAPRMMVKDHPLAEKGKPFDHKLKMVDNIAKLMKCPPSRINVKARTHEKVDAVGEMRAISCHVVAVLERAP